MNWTDQAETMVKTWTEAQKKMWENWYDWAQTGPTPGMFETDIFDQWRSWASQGLESMVAGAEPTAKDLARRLFASQEAMIRFLKLSANAWKTMAVRVEAGESWDSVLAEYTEELRQQMVGVPERMFHVAQDSNKLWQLYMEELEKLAQPWVNSLKQAPGYMGPWMSGNGSELLELSRLYWDAYERTFGRFLESPSLGYTRELNETILKGFDAWQDFRQASFEYQVIAARTWTQAFERLMKELVSRAERDDPIQSVRQLIQTWNNVADETFIKVFQTEEYIRAQGKLLETVMTYRLRQREIVEMFLRISDVPTRTEVDEAHRNIYEQNKAIKALKKQVAALSTSVKAVEQKNGSSASEELAEAQQSIKTLQAEVESLKKALAEVTAPARKTTTKSSKSSTKRKPRTKASAASSNTDNEGGKGATVSNSDSS